MRMRAQCESPTLWCNNDVTVNVEKLLLQDSLDFHRYMLFFDTLLANCKNKFIESCC